MGDPRQRLSFVPDDYMDATTDQDSWIEAAAVIHAAMLWFCDELGHVPVPDQCGRPEHWYCQWCNTSTPKED